MTQQEALYSRYLLDGMEASSTPAELIRDYGECQVPESDYAGDIVDETLDPAPIPCTFDRSEIPEYVSRILGMRRDFPVRYARAEAKLHAAEALCETLWLDGHFRLGNLRITPQWTWNDSMVGNMSAFYDSVEALVEFAGEAGIRLDGYGYSESGDICRLDISTRISKTRTIDEEESELIIPGLVRRCAGRALPDRNSWIVYVPFDTCPYRLGGSALSEFAGNGGDNASEIQDADYFIDCYEVIREMVEDGVAMSGVTVAKGGLMTAAAALCSGTGLELDISGLASSCGETNTARLLFGEVPGVLVQFNDNDFDYIDSQFLLQDVAYYPVGHPCGTPGTINIINNRKPAVTGILDSLLKQAGEGED